MTIGLQRLVLAVVVLAGAADARAAVIVQQTLGDQDFANLAIVNSGVYLPAATGEPNPFNQIFGGDATDNGSFSWTFSYGPIATPIGSARLLMALYETESAATGNQIASFTLNGVDLTAQMQALHEATPGTSSQIVHYELVLPSTVFAQLTTGTATFSIALQGPGLGILGDTTFNGGGIDFSRLTIEDTATPPPPVPEPATMLLVAAGLAAVARSRRRPPTA